MRSGWLDLPEGRIETAWWGPGPAEGPTGAPTIVLLHEGLGCVALWRDVPERLAEATGLGVFAYSRFGYGQSDPVTLPRPMTYMHHEGQVVLPQVLAAAGVREAVLVGHSDGGSIAAIYAGMVGARRVSPFAGEDRTFSLATDEGLSSLSWPGLSRPSTTYGADPSKGMDGRDKPGHDSRGEAHDGNGRLSGTSSTPHLHAMITIAAHFFVEDLNTASIRQIKDTYETTDLRARLGRYHRDPDIAFYGWNGAWLDPRFRDFDITGFLPGISVPTLGLQGADDPYGTDEQLRVMQAHVTAPIETHLIEGARHAPHLEAREATMDAIARFIAATVRQSVP
jgi:pimeloyl-ACP methyl ester carboxylesterase